jgi:hypothetical protein
VTLRDRKARLQAYAGLAREIAPNVLVHGLPSADMIDEATAAGFTHASEAPYPAEAPVA